MQERSVGAVDPAAWDRFVFESRGSFLGSWKVIRVESLLRNSACVGVGWMSQSTTKSLDSLPTGWPGRAASSTTRVLRQNLIAPAVSSAKGAAFW